MPRRHLSRIGLSESAPPPPPPERGGGHGYPRPLLRREEWSSLNGQWDFALDPGAQWTLPEEVRWERTILVPFAPETPRSGIGDTGLYEACWYRRGFETPALDRDERLLLHFNAVDYTATVWVDGSFATTHEGGYTPFHVDLTDLLVPRDTHEIIVRAHDDPHDLAKPRGKQDWQLDPHSIWYPRTTGIWQTVWLERVPRVRIGYLRWTASLERWDIGVEARIVDAGDHRLRLGVRLGVDGLVLAHDQYSVVSGEVHRRISLSDPGIDDFRNTLLWSPATPTLIEAELELLGPDGERLDRVRSYTALRSIAVEDARVVLNGRPYPLRMVLDQGYWVDTGHTAPDDDALRRDVELTKEMGFNGARKHQKIEDPRYLYWADRLGLLVWEEMPSAYRFTKRSIERMTRQWLEVLRRDANHPCIIAWVPFNESWGVPNLPGNIAERHYIQALYYLTKTFDPTRPVVGNDGWESVATDIIGVHDYDPDAARLRRRYHVEHEVVRFLRRERPGGRALILDGAAGQEHPIVLSEFGGLAYSPDAEGTWGYARCRSPEELAHRYRELLAVVQSIEVLAGFCYTQFADTYQEANGLLYADRTPKFPIEEIAYATGRRAIEEAAAPPWSTSGISLTERTSAPR
jgi:beta-galactosidase/beta-glucuronidase